MSIDTTAHFDSRDEAILHAIKAMEPGDETWIHQDACIDQHRQGDDCDCGPILLTRPAPHRPIGFGR